MEEKHLICIHCPLGCALTAQVEGGTVRAVAGNTCPRGADYARQELTAPVRTVTTTVPVEGGVLAAVPVKTAGAIPKARMFDCVRALRAVRLTAPVRLGQVVLRDAAGTGVDVVAARTVEAL